MSGRYDVIIVGGGPAGLSAALLLGRCCRRVLLCDAGEGRNNRSPAVFGFLSRDGTPPGELRRTAREQLARYPTVQLRDVLVTDARRQDAGFSIDLASGERLACRKLLLATGMVDEVPPIPGLRERWGRSVFPCPYCDGFEFRGRPLGVLGRDSEAAAECRAVTTWSDRVMLVANGPAQISGDDRHRLQRQGVEILEQPLVALEGPDTALEKLRLGDGREVPCQALFVAEGQRQRSPLVSKLGCRLDPAGVVPTRTHESTEIPGLYVAGDASDNLQLAIVAAAEGAEAAFAINRALVRDRFGLPVD
jgi:thioredoxin reductase